MKSTILILHLIFLSFALAGQRRWVKLISEIGKEGLLENECTTSKLYLEVSKYPGEQYEFIQQGQPAYIINLERYADFWSYCIDSDVRRINKSHATIYSLYENYMCPNKTGEIIMPEATFRLLRKKNGVTDTVSLKSDGYSFYVRNNNKVKEKVYSNYGYRMIGNYVIEETKLPEFIDTGDTVEFSVAIKGENTFPIQFTDYYSDSISIINSHHRTSLEIGDDKCITRKEMNFEIIAYYSGNYDLGKYLKWKYYNTSSEKYDTLKSKQKIQVNGTSTTPRFPKPVERIIMLDVSETMRVEDLFPNRLSNGFQIAKAIANNCDDPFLVFRGNTFRSNICSATLTSMQNKAFAEGTSLAEAIWSAIRLSKNSRSQPEVYIISDGENTDGRISISKALNIALENSIRINTIVVGNTGKAKLGVDLLFGNPVYANRSLLSDKDLKRIADITSGKFYRTRDYESIDDLIKVLRLN